MIMVLVEKLGIERLWLEIGMFEFMILGMKYFLVIIRFGVGL